jgi:hypothetical protein
MRAADVLPILRGKHIDVLYHANSMATSEAFFRLRGLVSRGRVEAEGMRQTAQYTDDGDRRFNVWNDVFTDSVDLHTRMSRRNQYGPLLFELDVGILAVLPEEVEVHLTRTNPSKWAIGQSHEDRYFHAPGLATAGFVRGTFDHMITFRTASGLIPFGDHLRRIVLDNPQMIWVQSQASIFEGALARVHQLAADAGLTTPIVERQCHEGCRCVSEYQTTAGVTAQLFST